MKTSRQLIDILGTQIDRLIAKKTTPAHVNAVSNAAGKILTTVRIEMEYAKMLGKKPNTPFITS